MGRSFENPEQTVPVSSTTLDHMSLLTGMGLFNRFRNSIVRLLIDGKGHIMKVDDKGQATITRED